MGSPFHRLQSGCIFLLLFFVVSCSMHAVKTPEREKDLSQETSRLEKLAREDPNASVRAQSHLQLAFLYVNHKNPQLNYSRALQEMENYRSLTPGEVQTDDFQNWFAVLKEVGKLKISLERMQKANKSLSEEVAGLKETIERVKSLDRQMEEKRRLTK